MTDSSFNDAVLHQERMNVIKEQHDTALIEKVKAAGFDIARDGNMWCALLGRDLMEGEAFFEPTYMGAVGAAWLYLERPLP